MPFDQELVRITLDLRLFARSRVLNQAGADDLVQKILLRAVERIRNLEGETDCMDDHYIEKYKN